MCVFFAFLSAGRITLHYMHQSLPNTFATLPLKQKIFRWNVAVKHHIHFVLKQQFNVDKYAYCIYRQELHRCEYGHHSIFCMQIWIYSWSQLALLSLNTGNGETASLALFRHKKTEP